MPRRYNHDDITITSQRQHEVNGVWPSSSPPFPVSRSSIHHRNAHFLPMSAEELHPLEHDWVLWEHTGGGGKNPNAWKENMKELCAFNTVEDFWRYFNHIPKPADIFYDGDTTKRLGPDNKKVEEYSLFKKGIEPEWGDPANATGGEWFCRQFFEGEVLNLCWQNLVLGVVGETIEDAVDGGDGLRNYINGCRVVDKGKNFPMFRLELWISTKDAAIKEKIRDRMMEIVTEGVPPSKKGPRFDWKDHS